VTTLTSPALDPCDQPTGSQTTNPPSITRSDGTATRAVLAASVTIVLWASAFVVIRSSGAHLSPGPMALARVAVATLVLTPFVLRGSARRAGPLLPRGRAILPVVGYGALWFAGYNVALNAAERHVDAGTAALLVNIAPVLIAIGGGVFLREGFSRPLFLGCAVAFGGVALMATGSTGERDSLGIALALVAAVLYASSVIMQKVTLRSIDALRATWLGCLVGTLVTLPFAGELVHEAQGAPFSALLGAAYLGAFPTAVAFTTWAYALTHTDAGALSLTTFLVPGIATLVAWLTINEVPPTLSFVGGALAIVGVLMTRRKPRTRDRVS
jgi:drug/metabolite transporter (DMT)-like permease